MNEQAIRIAAPSRLHFGLIINNESTSRVRKHCGIGAMIRNPHIEMELHPASQLEITGAATDRVERAVKNWFFTFGETLEPGLSSYHQLPCKIELATCPQLHIGLGVGTQLAHCVSMALCRSAGLPTPQADQLAGMNDRAKRSSVGTFGFCQGGFVVDGGKPVDQAGLGELIKRVDIPMNWRVLLLTIRENQNVSGNAESMAFDELNSAGKSSQLDLLDFAVNQVLPTVESENFEDFGPALYEYNFRVGRRFASVQNGPFNGTRVSRAIHAVREMGVSGVGQSSWGPTIYAWTENHENAQQLWAQCRECADIDLVESWIAVPDNQGCIIQEL